MTITDEPLTAEDRLRLHVGDPETFAFSYEDADALVAEIDSLRTSVGGAVKERKGFPILGQGTTIHWQLVADHGAQAKRNHSQTVERLAERGGLSWCELHAVLHNRPWQKMVANEAMIACRALEARYLSSLTPSLNGGVTEEMVDRALARSRVKDLNTLTNSAAMREILTAALSVARGK